ncbi:MAG: DUF2721 domain-containing protein [Betaproteobacteria bacterium]|nr:DUF2721 domain-containing protein [Betaproteobacteria bacterium]
MEGVAHSIQLALAPVFMLTAIAGLIGALAGRLARIIDRGRKLEDRLDESHTPHKREAEYREELARLRRRARIVNTSMLLLALSATLISATVMELFLIEAVTLKTDRLIPWTFLSGVFCFLMALVAFLIETLLAGQSLNFGKRQP